MYAALADPDGWAMRPWEIARLTDWQIEHLYLGPAERRAAKRDGRPDPAPRPAGRKPLTREAYIRAGRDLFGQSAEYWGRQWDEAQARDEQARQRPTA